MGNVGHGDNPGPGVLSYEAKRPCSSCTTCTNCTTHLGDWASGVAASAPRKRVTPPHTTGAGGAGGARASEAASSAGLGPPPLSPKVVQRWCTLVQSIRLGAAIPPRIGLESEALQGAGARGSPMVEIGPVTSLVTTRGLRRSSGPFRDKLCRSSDGDFLIFCRHHR